MSNEAPVPGNFSQFQIGGVTKLIGGEMQSPRSVQIAKEIKMQLTATPEDDPFKMPELLGKDLLERSGSVPIPGSDLMEEITSVEIGENGDTTELEDVLRRAWAFREGLTYGVSGEAFNFDPARVSSDETTRSKVKKLQTMFATVEGAKERQRSDYVDIAIEEALEKRVREAQLFRDDPDKYKSRIRKRLMANALRIGLAKEQIDQMVEDRANQLANEYAAIPKLIELSNHSKARELFDFAFRHRMSTCEDPGEAAKLGGSAKPTVTPDGQHFETLYKGEGKYKETANGVTVEREGAYGKMVNEVLEEMVKVALPKEVVIRLGMSPIPDELRKYVPETVYGVGFDNATMFAYWLDHMKKKANGRMDVVWQAWKQMLTWEVADDLGQGVNARNKFVLASPPIGNPLMTVLAHFREKTATEFGLDASLGTRTQQEKFIIHSGHPYLIGKVPNLCEQYFIEASVSFDKTYLDKPWMIRLVGNALKNLPKKGDKDYASESFRRQKYFDNLRLNLEKYKNASPEAEKISMTLWDIWLYGRIGFNEKDFPWFATEQAEIDPVKGSLPTSGELPSGSVGMWFLTRSRCWGERGSGVANEIKSIPTSKELSDPKFFVEKIRNWAKVLGTTTDDEKPEDNIRTLWLVGVLSYHLAGDADSGAFKRRAINDYRDPSKADALGWTISGTQTGKKEVTFGDVLDRAVECGFIRKDEKNQSKSDFHYILKQLGVTLRNV